MNHVIIANNISKSGFIFVNLSSRYKDAMTNIKIIDCKIYPVI